MDTKYIFVTGRRSFGIGKGDHSGKPGPAFESARAENRRPEA